MSTELPERAAIGDGRRLQASSRIRAASVFVRDLQLTARLGVYPREERTEQPIRLNIEIGTPGMQRAVDSGRLADTTDYVGIADIARDVVARGHYRLVETLAHTLAEELLAASDAAWVRVRLDKIGCLLHAKAAGVEVVIDRDAAITHPRPLALQRVETPEEVVVVGGGVAGLSAALWVDRIGHRALLLDPAERLGGQLHLVHRPMPDVPGMAPLTGIELARQLWQQFERHGGRWLRLALERVDGAGGGPVRLVGTDVSTDREVTLEARTVVICSGLRRNLLGVPGEQRLLGRGLLATAARDSEQLEGHHVVVVGGGDSACENALLLAATAGRVTLVHRGERLTARARFRERVARSQRIERRPGTAVTAFLGEQRLTAVELRSAAGETQQLAADAALVRVGWCPNSEPLPASWLDELGHVRVDLEGRVIGEQRAFAAGDIVAPVCPSVAVSIGTGATAARSACELLER